MHHERKVIVLFLVNINKEFLVLWIYFCEIVNFKFKDIF